ncbi:MAG: hypothetical protein ACKOWF_09890, partial [Chloroflexota bacterium]
MRAQRCRRVAADRGRLSGINVGATWRGPEFGGLAVLPGGLVRPFQGSRRIFEPAVLLDEKRTNVLFY